MHRVLAEIAQGWKPLSRIELMATDMFSYLAAQLAPSQNDHIFALVDCSIDDRVHKRISGGLNSANHINLFKGTFAAEAESLSPVLIDLAGSSSGSGRLLERLLTACEGKPLLSFISANISLDQLADHLKQILIIKTADGQEFFLRYADNRVLPAIFSVLTNAQQHAFLGPIHKWLVATHRADVVTLTPPEGDQERLEMPLQLDDQQFAGLLEKSEVRFIVSQLEQAKESFADSHPLATRIQFVERNVANARRYGFNDTEDQTAWCMAALRGGEHFFMHELVSPLLERARDSQQKLFDSLMFLPQEDWQSIASAQLTK